MSWNNPPTETAVERRWELPDELAWNARVHYWRFIHRGEPHKVIVVDAHNWQTGRHAYFVPVHYATDERALIERHTLDKPGFSSEIHVLFWHEFERKYPRA